MARRISRPRKRMQSLWPTWGNLAMLAIVALVAVSVIVPRVLRHDMLTRWRQALERDAGRPPWPEWSTRWAPLPQPPRKAHRLPQDLRGPYAFAARRPDVLGHVPCYCGCVRDGHRSNLSCFVDRFGPDGNPVWTPHSFTCDMCVHIAREAMLMSSRGVSGEVIAEQIEKHYGGLGQATDTPRSHVPGHQER